MNISDNDNLQREATLSISNVQQNFPDSIYEQQMFICNNGYPPIYPEYIFLKNSPLNLYFGSWCIKKQKSSLFVWNEYEWILHAMIGMQNVFKSNKC